MTLYAGEPVRIRHSATRPGSIEPITAAEIAAVWIVVYHGTDVVVEETEMSWDDDAGEWYHVWDSTDAEAGGYRAKVRIEGVDGFSPWEFQTFRLTRNPV